MRLTRVTQLTAGLIVALCSMPLYAVSLGNIQMHSSLGQPLLAEIPLYDTNDIDLQELTVQIASRESYSRLGLDPKQSQDLQIAIVTDDNGKLFVQLKSDAPYNEPVLNLLLEAQWENNGRLVKELTALVDPPYISKTAVQTINAPTVILSPVVAPPVILPSNPVRTPSIPTGTTSNQQIAPVQKPPQPDKKTVKEVAPKKAETQLKQGEVAASKQPVVQSKPIQPVQIPATPNNTIIVEQGDNLNDIAIKHNKEIGNRISLNQMMTAIQRANSNAFIKNNPNLLKKGSILRLPDEQQALAMMPEDAANLLKSQWAKNINAQPAPILDSANKLSNKTGTAKKPAGATGSNAAIATTNQGRLKIVPTVGAMNNASSQSGASKSGQGQELRTDSAQTQEEIATRQSEIVTLKTQLEDASKLQVESKRLIELQNSQIKLLTQRMQELEKGLVKDGVSKSDSSLQTNSKENVVEAPWYYNSNVVIVALLLIAVLLGVLLKRKK
ncbi:MAG TPA: FimV/HubP family polar landmark protein [Arenimonas sp.]|nr:FimV/HubP family polar landmark protein [Arenimonas sp.]